MRRGRLGERNEGPYAAGPDDLPAALSTRDKKRGRAAAPLLFVVSRYPPSRGGTGGRPISVCVCATDRLGRRDGRDAQSTGRPTGRPFFCLVSLSAAHALSSLLVGSLSELGAQSRLRPQSAFAEAELVHAVIAPAVSVAPAGMPVAACAPCLPVGGLSCKSQDRRHRRSITEVRDRALRAMRLLRSSFDVASEHDRAAHDQRDDSNDDCRDDPARNPGEIEEPADDSTAPRPGG
jgi:hypothetical protein